MKVKQGESRGHVKGPTAFRLRGQTQVQTKVCAFESQGVFLKREHRREILGFEGSIAGEMTIFFAQCHV